MQIGLMKCQTIKFHKFNLEIKKLKKIMKIVIMLKYQVQNINQKLYNANQTKEIPNNPNCIKFINVKEKKN